MLTKRNREFPPQKSDAASFAAKATDLQALRDAVVDAAGVSTGLWLSYLFVLFYFAIATGAVTHRDLFLENPVKLPFLNVELPLKAFFVLGPLIFVVVHAYVLLHFVLLAGKIGAFDVELEAQIAGDDVKSRLRRQLPSNIFMQSLAGPHEERTGTIGFLLRLIGRISLVAGPIALLVLFQLQFLPYHNQPITMWQRAAVVIDLGLLWILWPPIERGETARLRWSDFRQVKVQALLLVSILPVLLVFTIATFPGEWLQENLLSMPLVPTTWAAVLSGDERALQDWASLHELLVAGEVNYVTRKPQSLWSNRLVLPDFEIGDRLKFDAEGKIVISPNSVSLRGRRLEGAVLVEAHLSRADFTGAWLDNADFFRADLRDAKFECDKSGANCTQLRRTLLVAAELQRASLKGAQMQDAALDAAHLQDAKLDGANLQSASFGGAELERASLDNAQLQDADLKYARLKDTALTGAQLDCAELEDARLDRALLGGASLQQANLQGASLQFADLAGASLQRAQLQGATLKYADMMGAALDYADLQGAVLNNAQLQGASLGGAHLQAASLDHVFVWKARPPVEEDLMGALIAAPETRPKYRGLDCRLDFPAECDWSDQAYQSLKSQIDLLPSGPLRDAASKRIEPLAQPPFTEDAGSPGAWKHLEEVQQHPPRLSEILIKVGCATAGAPYVVRRLIWELDVRFPDDHTAKAAVAAAFLDEAHCPGARGLREEDNAKLRQIRDRATAPSPTPSLPTRPGNAAR